LKREEVEELVLDGFFPRVEAGAAPPKAVRAGIQEFGLPYASERRSRDTPRTSSRFTRAARRQCCGTAAC